MKELVLVDTHAQTRVADLRIRSLPYLRADIAMYDLLKLFQTGRSHMVVLTKPPEPAPAGNIVRASSQEVTVQVEEAKDRLSPSVSCITCGNASVQDHAFVQPVQLLQRVPYGSTL